ncbi:MAG: phosphatase PAP2 family protein [Acutalibacter sp.]|jgi:undecaprenyl-diphosphatase|uniref:phosphatase PAP2 family protein n=1 Tax=Acutalibacter sp. TaxID=1918636 RepID=UPI0013736B06|nr:phosphatase PAP2 family protein [Acutalibacter sp.]MCI9224248.1 phosphatase PAP2 family protein [Acutalibacter sp.]
MNPFDSAVMTFVQSGFHNPVTDTIFPAVTYLGESGIFWILLSLLIIALGRKNGWRTTGCLMLAAMLLGLLLGEIALKNIICRPRPFQEMPEISLLIPPPSGYSFPSGHSCASFAAATIIFLKDKRPGTAALALAALIAFSRVFLFVHYPTDVLAGSLLGVLCALAAAYGYRRLFQKKAP